MTDVREMRADLMRATGEDLHVDPRDPGGGAHHREPRMRDAPRRRQPCREPATIAVRAAVSGDELDVILRRPAEAIRAIALLHLARRERARHGLHRNVVLADHEDAG